MKISRPDRNFPVNSTAAVGPSSNRPLKPISSAPPDQVDLSNLSSYLASALSGSPAHVAKVEKLATNVSSGQYHVDSYAVSGSIIQHSIEFGGSAYLALST